MSSIEVGKDQCVKKCQWKQKIEILQKLVIEQNVQLPTPPSQKLWSPVFQVLMEMDNFHQPLCKNGKTICRAKCLITDLSRSMVF